jgi:hypothetical protein
LKIRKNNEGCSSLLPIYTGEALGRSPDRSGKAHGGGVQSQDKDNKISTGDKSMPTLASDNFWGKSANVINHYVILEISCQ